MGKSLKSVGGGGSLKSVRGGGGSLKSVGGGGGRHKSFGGWGNLLNLSGGDRLNLSGGGGGDSFISRRGWEVGGKGRQLTTGRQKGGRRTDRKFIPDVSFTSIRFLAQFAVSARRTLPFEALSVEPHSAVPGRNDGARSE